MKHLIILILLAFGVALHSNVCAQITNFAGIDGVPLKLNPYKETEGTPYLNDGKWFSGNFVNKYGKQVMNVAMRYNIFEDALECNYQNKPYIFEGEDIREFIYYVIDKSGRQEVYHFKSGIVIPGNVNKDDYVQILYEGKNFQILKKYFVQKINVAPASYGGLKNERFVQSEKMWILTADGITEINKVSRKVLIDTFPELEKEIKKFTRVHEVDWTSYSDIYAFCNYLDQTIIP